MDLTSIVLFLVMYYIRPQEWFGILASIHFVQIVMVMALTTLFFRERSLKAADLLKTPHDWMMLFFFVWMIGSSSTPWETFKNNYALAVFYVVIVQTLTTVPRMKVFVGWWTFLIVAIAALAIASEYGFDPLGGNEITHGRMKNRLILNLWIFNNPNALGHNVAPAIPMLYFFAIWKRPLFIKQIGLAILVVPLWCIFLTVSKGAFLVAAIILVATVVFGRPKGVQIVVVCAALALGGTAISFLPRMNELEKAKTDGAIQGRVAAFKHGLFLVENSIRGCGRDQWMPNFFHAHRYYKACHSSYVQVGAELGAPGLALFLGILYCSMRTLITAKTGDPDDERIRRTLFVLVLSYMASSWMVDFGFRPTFFMFSAAVAAFHRHLYGLNLPAGETAPFKSGVPLPAWRRPVSEPAMTSALATVGASPASVLTLGRAPLLLSGPTRRPAWISSANREPEPQPAKRIYWRRIELLDVVLVSVFTIATIKFWALMVERM